jgi:serine/threonine protein phosphatase PrpC
MPVASHTSMHKLPSPSTAVLLPGPTPSARALGLRLGLASHPAPGKPNEDFHAVVMPSDAEGLRQGVILAVADGVSGSALARVASEVTVRGVTADYYSTPAHWSVGRALDRLLRSANDWLWAQNSRRPDEDCVVTAISIVVLRDQHYYLAHVGDTRVYRSRERVFKQLTSDHTWQRKDMRHVLRRAVGLDSHLVVDFADGELRAGDVFLMVSDGVWEVLGESAMTEILHRDLEPQPVAQALVQAAVRRQAAYMGRNDATAIVLRVDALVES